MERYNRQMMLPEIGTEGQGKLQAAKVLVVGVGGLGSPIALYLAGAGVGTLGLVDCDVVDVSNLHRQVLYTEDETGDLKAVCAAMRLQALNRSITIHAFPCRLTKENAEELIGAYDLVVDGCDNFATRYLINDVCVKLGKPYVYGAICGFEGQVSVFNHNSDKTYRDLFPDEELMLKMPPPPKGVIGMTPGVTGCVQAMEAVKIICGLGEVMAGKLWTIDIRTLQTNIFSL